MDPKDIEFPGDTELGLVDTGAAPAGLVDAHDVPRNIGRYTILEEVGRGGLGTVYAAYDPELDRRVALKLVRADRLVDEGATQAQARLVREAHAMAKLAHANVVHVYDAGTVDDRVFIAMQFVAGGSLRAWMDEGPHPLAEVLEVFVAAGRGLIAAHAEGMIHRDFKPDNVMLDGKGGVFVADFGLARSVTQAEPSIEQTGDSEPVRDRATHSLTGTGALVGTPAYMAPEQIDGQPPGTATDQFAFCVALWEAVCGERPFAGRTMVDLFDHVARGEIRSVPSERSVPTWLVDAMARGLSVQPRDRWPDMAMLVAELERERGGSSTALLIGAGATIVAVGATVASLFWVRTGPEPCAGLDGELQSMWNDPVRAELRSSILATGVGFAASTADRVDALLSAYADRWVDARTEACQTAPNEPEAISVRKGACLEERKRSLSAFVEVLSEDASKAVFRAIDLAAALPPVEQCQDPRYLEARVVLPADDETRSAVEQIRSDMRRARTLVEAGRAKTAVDVSEAALKAARASQYMPVIVEALDQHSFVLFRLGRADEADELLEEAYIGSGLASKGTELAIHYRLASLANAAGRQAEAEREARWSLTMATELFGPESKDVAGVRQTLGNLRFEQGDYDRAMEEWSASMRLFEKVFGPEHPDTLSGRNNVAIALASAGKIGEAIEMNEATLEIRARVLGVEHPGVAATLNNLGLDYKTVGRHEDALDAHDRALSIYVAAYGEEHPRIANTLDNRASALKALGRPDEALADRRRTLEIREATLGDEHPSVAGALLNMCGLLVEAGQVAEAEANAKRSLAIFDAAKMQRHPNYAIGLDCVAEIALAAGRADEAVGLVERSLEIRKAAYGEDHPAIGLTLKGLAEALDGAGRAEDAASARAESARILSVAEAG